MTLEELADLVAELRAQVGVRDEGMPKPISLEAKVLETGQAMRQALESALLTRLETEARIAVLTARLVGVDQLGQFERDVTAAVAVQKERFVEDAAAEVRAAGWPEAEVQAYLERLATVLA